MPVHKAHHVSIDIAVGTGDNVCVNIRACGIGFVLPTQNHLLPGRHRNLDGIGIGIFRGHVSESLPICIVHNYAIQRVEDGNRAALPRLDGEGRLDGLVLAHTADEGLVILSVLKIGLLGGFVYFPTLGLGHEGIYLFIIGPGVGNGYVEYRAGSFRNHGHVILQVRRRDGEFHNALGIHGGIAELEPGDALQAREFHAGSSTDGFQGEAVPVYLRYFDSSQRIVEVLGDIGHRAFLADVHSVLIGRIFWENQIQHFIHAEGSRDLAVKRGVVTCYVFGRQGSHQHIVRFAAIVNLFICPNIIGPAPVEIDPAFHGVVQGFGGFFSLPAVFGGLGLGIRAGRLSGVYLHVPHFFAGVFFQNGGIHFRFGTGGQHKGRSQNPVLTHSSFSHSLVIQSP